MFAYSFYISVKQQSYLLPIKPYRFVFQSYIQFNDIVQLDTSRFRPLHCRVHFDSQLFPLLRMILIIISCEDTTISCNPKCLLDFLQSKPDTIPLPSITLHVDRTVSHTSRNIFLKIFLFQKYTGPCPMQLVVLMAVSAAVQLVLDE